jgi:hypothetical protein
VVGLSAMSERTSVPSKTRIRKLRQFKDMSDDDFDLYWDTKAVGITINREFDTRVEKKIDEFSKDYDLSDLKINDMLVLRALAQALITLEDLEHFSYNERLQGINMDAILSLEKLNNIMSSLRKDISNMQNDLKITRRIRKGDREESVINYLEDLKLKAKKFYESRMQYIFCPKCNMLLATAWFLYLNETGNRIICTCHRKLSDGTECGEIVNLTSKDLLKLRGSNLDSTPEYFK